MNHLHTFNQHINESEEPNLPEEVREIEEEKVKEWGRNSTLSLSTEEQKLIDKFLDRVGADTRTIGLVKLTPPSEGYKYFAMFRSGEDTPRFFTSVSLEGLFKAFIMTSQSSKVRQQFAHYIEWIKIK